MARVAGVFVLQYLFNIVLQTKHVIKRLTTAIIVTSKVPIDKSNGKCIAISLPGRHTILQTLHIAVQWHSKPYNWEGAYIFILSYSQTMKTIDLKRN